METPPLCRGDNRRSCALETFLGGMETAWVDLVVPAPALALETFLGGMETVFSRDTANVAGSP